MEHALVAETIAITGHGGDAVEAYHARPLGPGPFPSVLLVHHMPGWDEATKEIARKLAFHGYATIAPHLFSREGGPGVSAEDAAAAARAAETMTDERFLGDATAAISFLRQQPYASGKVGVIGYCSGGRQAFMSGCRLPVDAAIACYGGNVVVGPDKLNARQPMAVIDMVPDLSCPLLCFFGVDDPNPSQDDMRVTEARLAEHHKDFEIQAYEGAGHGFFSVDRPAYRVEAAKDGWQRVFSFFGRHLAAAEPHS